MPRREFAGLKALRDYAHRNRKLYVYEGTPQFAERQRRLSPEQYEIADVRYSQGVSRVLLFPKAILKAEWDAAPLRHALRIKRAPKKEKPSTD